jgi:hypothetical protein
VSESSYYEVMHEGGPLGGQQVRYAGEPKLRLSKHGGTYVREALRTDDGAKRHAYVYRWEADAEGQANARVPQDGDDASDMLGKGPVIIPAGSSMAVSFSGEANSDDEDADAARKRAQDEAIAAGTVVPGEQGPGAAEQRKANEPHSDGDQSTSSGTKGSAVKSDAKGSASTNTTKSASR